MHWFLNTAPLVLRIPALVVAMLLIGVGIILTRLFLPWRIADRFEDWALRPFPKIEDDR